MIETADKLSLTYFADLREKQNGRTSNLKYKSPKC